MHLASETLLDPMARVLQVFPNADGRDADQVKTDVKGALSKE